jgi:DNA repair protein RadC
MSEYKKLNIKEWAAEDRPREKLIANGPRAMSDAELIAILIGSGNTGETAVELSRRILSSVNNNLNELGRKGIDYLRTFNGIGEAKAITIMAAIELGKRRREENALQRDRISNSNDAAEYFRPVVGDLEFEEFWIMFLDRGNNILGRHQVSKGGISGTVIDVRLIMKEALSKQSSSIILCHNHPSGNLSPSDADLKITWKIRDAGEIMDIKVLDHVIIAGQKYYSFADEGILDTKTSR